MGEMDSVMNAWKENKLVESMMLIWH